MLHGAGQSSAGDEEVTSHQGAAWRTGTFIEAGLAGKSRDEIADARRTRAKPIYEKMLSWARAIRSREPPKSALARAVSYQLGNEIALTRYLDDPDLPPDNGLVERLHRRPALMRMNALFAGSHEGGRRAAIITSVTASCRLAGVNATAYLTDVIPRLQRGVAERDLPALLARGMEDRARLVLAPECAVLDEVPLNAAARRA